MSLDDKSVNSELSPNRLDNKNIESESEKNAKSNRKNMDPEKRNQLIADIYIGIIVATLFILILGGIWAIKDIFTTTAYQSFLSLTTASKFLIVALIIFGLVFIALFLLVLYKRGRKSLYEKLFKGQKIRNRDAEEFKLSQIITGGSLISIFVIFFGLLIASIEYLVQYKSSTDNSIWSFFGDLTGGLRLLLIGFLLLVLIGLVIGFHFLWKNGYDFFMKTINKFNDKFNNAYPYEGNQKTIANVVFGFFIGTIVLITIGIIWAILDAVAFNWSTTFSNYPFGIQFSFIGFLAVIFFIVLIAAMMAYKWGLNIISTALFGKKTTENIEKDNLEAKVLTVFMLISMVLLIFSAISWLSSLIANAISHANVSNLFIAFQNLSTGLQLLSYGLLLFVILSLSILFVYILKNGYYIAFKWVSKTEEVLEESMNKSAENKDKKDVNDSNSEK